MNELLFVPAMLDRSFVFVLVATSSHRILDAPLASFSRHVVAVTALVAGRLWLCACTLTAPVPAANTAIANAIACFCVVIFIFADLKINL
jgi:hypothetical protein